MVFAFALGSFGTYNKFNSTGDLCFRGTVNGGVNSNRFRVVNEIMAGMIILNIFCVLGMIDEHVDDDSGIIPPHPDHRHMVLTAVQFPAFAHCM